MNKKKISEQQIINIAKKLVNQNEVPTLLTVRKQLGNRGSNSTIHKYLSKWKQQCFKQASQQKTTIDNSTVQNNTNWEEEKRTLEQTLSQQIAQNENYAKELINSEKINITLKEEVKQLQIINQQLQLELKEAATKNETLEQLHQRLIKEIDSNSNTTINQQQQIIIKLQEELHHANTTSVELIRQTSAEGHDLLMQERVQTINLQAKNDELNKQLAQTKKELNLTKEKLQAKQQPLLQQIAWQRKMIQQFIDFEQLKQAEEQQLKAKFEGSIMEEHGS